MSDSRMVTSVGESSTQWPSNAVQGAVSGGDFVNHFYQRQNNINRPKIRIMKTPAMSKISKFSRCALSLSCVIVIAAQLAASAATLINRYSFSDVDNGTGNVGSTIVDSVGGPTGDGSLPAGCS